MMSLFMIFILFYFFFIFYVTYNVFIIFVMMEYIALMLFMLLLLYNFSLSCSLLFLLMEVCLGVYSLCLIINSIRMKNWEMKEMMLLM